jgi:hypothetical protein
MTEFRAPTPDDKQWFCDRMLWSGFRGCEYNFSNTFLWNEVYRQDIARLGDFASVRLTDANGTRYLYPAGRGDPAGVIEALKQDADDLHIPFRLIGVTDEGCGTLGRLFPGRFAFQENRGMSDYLYLVDRLADLPGKHLHAKRNHIRRFEENFPDWRFEALNAENLPECLAMDEGWYRQNHVEGDTLPQEAKALRKGLACFRELGLEGGLIRAGGRVVAFAVGDRMGVDTYDIHFEKAFSEVQGAYTVINREYARWIRAHHGGVVYINRENDLDVPGLRKAKLSYRPDLLLAKYTAVET